MNSPLCSTGSGSPPQSPLTAATATGSPAWSTSTDRCRAWCRGRLRAADRRCGCRATTIAAAAGAAELAGDTLAEVPAFVLARTRGRWRSPRANAAVDRFWQDNQTELARLCRGPLVIAVDSGHDIPAGTSPGRIHHRPRCTRCSQPCPAGRRRPGSTPPRRRSAARQTSVCQPAHARMLARCHPNDRLPAMHPLADTRRLDQYT
jgi:hypothetical protein